MLSASPLLFSRRTWLAGRWTLCLRSSCPVSLLCSRLPSLLLSPPLLPPPRLPRLLQPPPRLRKYSAWEGQALFSPDWDESMKYCEIIGSLFESEDLEFFPPFFCFMDNNNCVCHLIVPLVLVPCRCMSSVSVFSTGFCSALFRSPDFCTLFFLRIRDVDSPVISPEKLLCTVLSVHKQQGNT